MTLPSEGLLRDGLLAERAVVLVGERRSAVAELLLGLGARLEPLESDVLGEERDLEEWVKARMPVHALVFDGREHFAGGGPEALGRVLEHAWAATRAVATAALIPGGTGKIVLIGPAAGAGPFVGAARDGLENTARTLSVEWARYAITTTMIAPGKASRDSNLATLVCYLLSEAGNYFSGCRLELA